MMSDVVVKFRILSQQTALVSVKTWNLGWAVNLWVNDKKRWMKNDSKENFYRQLQKAKHLIMFLGPNKALPPLVILHNSCESASANLNKRNLCFRCLITRKSVEDYKTSTEFFMTVSEWGRARGSNGEVASFIVIKFYYSFSLVFTTEEFNSIKFH